MNITRIHLPAQSPVARAWRAAEALAAHGRASASPPGESRLPMAATIPPPAQAFAREEAEAHAQAARAQSEAAAPANGAPVNGARAVSSNRAYAMRMVKAWSEKDAQAQAAGVNLRKSAFINKLIGTGAAFIMLGVAIAATVLTAGAATPFLAIATTRTALLVGDSMCAWVDWQRSKEAPPRKLPMGANCLANLIYSLAKGGGKTDADAKGVAKVLSGVLTLGLAAAGLAVGQPNEGMTLLSTLLRYASTGSVMFATGSQAKAADRYDDLAKARDRAKADLSVLMMEAAAAAPEGEAYRVWCADLQAELGHLDPDGGSREAFIQMTEGAWATIEQGNAPGSPVDADRSTTAQRALNDMLGLQAGANFLWTAAIHGDAMGALRAALDAG